MTIATNAGILLFAVQICLQAQSGFTPMTGEERRNVYFKRLFSPVSLAGSAVGVGISQWRDRPHEWPQGAKGYGYRYANSYGQHVIRETLMFASGSVLHEDYRYFRSGEQGTRNRILYAVKGSFMARGDDNRRHVSISRIGAYAGAALISRSWHPDSTRNFRSAGIAFGTSMGISMGFNVLREFWPRKKKP